MVFIFVYSNYTEQLNVLTLLKQIYLFILTFLKKFWAFWSEIFWTIEFLTKNENLNYAALAS